MHDNAPLVKEDTFHPALLVSVKFPLKCINFTTTNSNKAYNFRKANYPTIYNDFFETDWNYLQIFSDINLAIEGLYSKTI